MYDAIGGTPAVVSIVVGIIITILVSRYYFLKSKITRALGWVPLGINRIVTRPVDNLSKGLSLTFGGELLRTPYIVRLRIANIGSREIVAESDYQRPLSLKFERSKCYEAIITRSSGTTLSHPLAVISQPATAFDLPMPTLNMGAWIELEMIVDGETEYPQLSCMLVGETRPIAPVPDRRRAAARSVSVVAGGLSVFISSIGFGLMGLQSYNSMNGPSAWSIALLIIGLALLFGCAVTYSTCWWRDRQDQVAIRRAVPNAFD